MLIAILIFLLVLCSGSALGCAAGCRFEELVPVTGICVVLVLFLFGLAGGLAIGVYAVLALALAAWVLAAVRIGRGGFRPFVHRFFTAGFWLFLFLAAALLFFNYGGRITFWDEYSHWGDAVKIMTVLDAFVSDPRALSLFPDYPPGLSLFLYFLQKLLCLGQGGGSIAEWAMYYAQQLMMFSFFLPFVGRMDFKRLSSWAAPVLLFLCPLFLNEQKFIYHSLLVDGFLAVVFACAAADAILWRGDRAGLFRLLMMLAFLPLVKKSGLLLSLTIGAVFVLTFFYKADRRQRWRLCLTTALCVLLPGLLWNLHVRLSGAGRTFGLSLEGGLLGPEHYRLEAVKVYLEAFLTRNLLVEEQSALKTLTPIALTILSLTLLFLVLRCYARFVSWRPGLYRGYFWLLAGATALWLGGLCLMYMFAFKQWEALEAYCMERYIGTIFLGNLYLALLLALELIRQKRLNGGCFVALVLCAQALLIPWTVVRDYLDRGFVNYSLEYCQPFDEMIQRLRALDTDGTARFYILADYSFDKMVLRYNLRPSVTNPIEQVWDDHGLPGGYETKEAWLRDLVENYDYVLIYGLNETLRQDYGFAFSDPDEILPHSIYRVNRSTGLLEICR